MQLGMRKRSGQMMIGRWHVWYGRHLELWGMARPEMGGQKGCSKGRIKIVFGTMKSCLSRFELRE